MQDKPPSPLIDLYEAKSAERKMPVAIHQDAHIDEDVLQMEPHIKPRPRYIHIGHLDKDQRNVTITYTMLLIVQLSCEHAQLAVEIEY